MDFLEIGCTPNDEKCVPVNDKIPYVQAMVHECTVFKRYLQRLFPPPDTEGGVRLRVKGSSHDFGRYYEVVCDFEEDDEVAQEYALMLESSVPDHWDEAAKAELQASEDWTTFWRQYE